MTNWIRWILTGIMVGYSYQETHAIVTTILLMLITVALEAIFALLDKHFKEHVR